MILLTNKEIHDDIRAFGERILDAQSKLESLPAEPSIWKERKIRRELESEISHVQGLISIARSALTPDECQFVNKRERYATFNHK